MRLWSTEVIDSSNSGEDACSIMYFVFGSSSDELAADEYLILYHEKISTRQFRVCGQCIGKSAVRTLFADM